MATLNIGHYLYMETRTPATGGKERRQIANIPFALVAALWIVFFVLVTFWPGALEEIWTTFTGYQFAIRVVLGALFLPWTLATWVWHGTWDTALQIVTIGAIVLTTIITFRPTEKQAATE